MNATEERPLLSIDEAIKISKMICSVSEERIPLVLNVLEKAGVTIQGLDELEEWKALKDQAYIVDLDDFVAELFKDHDSETEVSVKPKEFNEVCEKFNVKPSCAKRALHRKGRIKATESQGKLEYTVPVYVDGKTERRIVIYRHGKAGEADGSNSCIS